MFVHGVIQYFKPGSHALGNVPSVSVLVTTKVFRGMKVKTRNSKTFSPQIKAIYSIINFKELEQFLSILIFY